MNEPYAETPCDPYVEECGPPTWVTTEAVTTTTTSSAPPPSLADTGPFATVELVALAVILILFGVLAVWVGHVARGGHR